MPGDEAEHDLAVFSVDAHVEEGHDPAFERGEVLVARLEHLAGDEYGPEELDRPAGQVLVEQFMSDFQVAVDDVPAKVGGGALGHNTGNWGPWTGFARRWSEPNCSGRSGRRQSRTTATCSRRSEPRPLHEWVACQDRPQWPIDDLDGPPITEALRHKSAKERPFIYPEPAASGPANSGIIMSSSKKNRRVSTPGPCQLTWADQRLHGEPIAEIASETDGSDAGVRGALAALGVLGCRTGDRSDR